MFEFTKAKIKSFFIIFLFCVKFDNLCKELLNTVPNRLENIPNHGNKFKSKTWKACKDIVVLKFDQEVYGTGKGNYHTVIIKMTSSNVFVVVGTGNYIILMQIDCSDWKKYFKPLL